MYQPSQMTGTKWQCIEYARRWLFIRKGCIFKDASMAAQMWDQLSYVERVIDGKLFPLKRYSNGSPKPPKKGSLLICKQTSDFPVSHVTVIVDTVITFISHLGSNKI
ncbi:unnamed protein product [Adineta ricciae]|uniref:Peptidase C51 domain-containing protein n=1 Tax=Adineta ricciae TaxID=249248 RepID=A0A814UE74_ADIRI|nr:unnamed protein product [Adineta ricciae]CAF1462919.1 unnamed protein product [Adineta ricciae]